MSDKLPILLRPANANDVPFIFSAWLKSYKNSYFTKDLANEIYYSEHHKVIEKILKYYDVVIACNEEDSSQIYGFICAGYTDNIFTVHFAYVKHTFRKMGIGASLLSSLGHDQEFLSVYTHKTKSAKALADRYNFVYHPYIGLDPESYNKKKAK